VCVSAKASKIGLGSKELERLARDGKQAIKCSRRDIAWVLATRQLGSTTVAATALLAAKAGISVFVTGGIGGVHRGAQETMDISADLQEMGRTKIAIVCAGVKSLLDIGLTLEVLETQGVTVITMGQKLFPSFYTRSSPFESPIQLDTVDQVADVVRANRVLDLNSGVLIAVPVPASEEAEADKVERAIQTALGEADAAHIKGIPSFLSLPRPG
jgi:pseudouridine-5'-phosphate glycosidase